MLYLSLFLLLLSVGLVIADALITKGGSRKGYRERNPILASVLGKFGMKGLLVTRLVAVTSLLLLFLILNTWEWVVFSSIFLGVMVVVVCVGVDKLRESPH